MERRLFPSVLLYGFALALALSLVFNGFLLYKQSRQRTIDDYELGSLAQPVDYVAWQQQLSDCKRANQQKDSLLYRLGQVPGTPAGKAVAVQRTPPNE